MEESVLKSYYSALVVSPKHGSEPVHDSGRPIGAAVVDFWRWYMSDMVSNATRGVLAEFLVASALGLGSGARSEWDAYDLEAEHGIKVEVKSAAYVQSWKQPNGPSKIVFSIQPSHALESETNQYAVERKRQADVYVFCLLHHKDKNTVDPLDLAQWTFYVLAASTLDAKHLHQKTMTRSSLLKLQPREVAYDELADAINGAGGHITSRDACGPVSKCGTMAQFLTRDDDQPFKDWMAQHPQGFYLNERGIGNIRSGKGEVLLHKVGCHHLGTGAGVISTTYAKVASDNAKELTDWSVVTGLTAAACSSCKPD